MGVNNNNNDILQDQTGTLEGCKDDWISQLSCFAPLTQMCLLTFCVSGFDGSARAAPGQQVKKP
jgi:hypothetical protein